MCYKIFNFLLFRLFSNLFEEIKKKKAKIFALYEIIPLFLGCIYLHNTKKIITILILYILIKIFTTKVIPECFYKVRYYKLKIESTYIVKLKRDKKKEKLNIIFFSYLDEKKFLSNCKQNVETFFNVTIISVNQDSYNKRKYNIIAQKGKAINNLPSILSGYGHLFNIVSDSNTDFYRKMVIDIKNVNLKDILKLKDDISFRLKKRTTIELENGKFVFKIFKHNRKKYNFKDAIKNIDIKEDNKLPCLLGIDQESGEYVIGDLTKMLNTFINGIVGSGKSVLFNSMIQSILLWNKNIQMILVDFKYVEFNQYKDFDNTLFIHKMKDFINFLDEIEKEMHQRYQMFDNGIKNISDYNNKFDSELPYILICIDELSFISSQPESKEIWQKLITIIQMGRACGIILLCATQCPDHTQINTAFRRQVDSKIIGRLRQLSDLKVCGIDSKEDVTEFDIGEFLLDAIGIGKIKIKSLFIDGLTNGLTDNLTKILTNKKSLKLGVPETKTCLNLKKDENVLTENEDLLKLCENYFKLLKRDSLVPSLKEAKTAISPLLTEKKYKTIKQELYKKDILYKSSPTSTKYKIKNIK